jgi:hypothetical protein
VPARERTVAIPLHEDIADRTPARPAKAGADPARDAATPGAGPGGILALQRAAGNAAVSGALDAGAGRRLLARRPASLPDQLRDAWAARHDKGEIFTILRRAPTGSDRAVLDTIGATPGVAGIFPAASDDCWLAAHIYAHGPEPLWPAALVQERARRAAGGSWGKEAGNIEATLADPDPDPGAKPLPPVQAFFFPGRSDRRALVIGGVHGTEPQGTVVVEKLRAALAAASAAGKPPFFTTILVPTVIPRTAKSGERFVPGGKSIHEGKLIRQDVEPNRNFPMPGEGYSQARARGAKGPDEPELVFQPPGGGPVRRPQDTPVNPKDPKKGHFRSSIRMLPETRILIALIERFMPERIASVHAHSLGSKLGDAPGIFVDPRKTGPTTSDPAQEAEDDRLAGAMLDAGLKTAPRKEMFAGNVKGSARTVRYSSSVHGEGSSLGDWAPVPVAGPGPGARGAITTLTIEVPQGGKTIDAKDMDRIEALDADLLQQIFLEDPATATPAPASPKKTP